MAFDTHEQLEVLLLEGVEASLRELRQDLERRIAVLLKQKDVFPPGVVINMARTISTKVADFVSHELWKSGEIRDVVRRLL